MSSTLTFSVLGVCVPFVRVQPMRRGGVYEDPKYKHWRSLVVDAAREAIERSGWKTATGPVRVAVEVVLVRRPTKTKRPKHETPITGKGVGDLENYLKPVLDAMTRAGVYADDKQVVEFVSPTSKRWQRPGETFAGVVVRVEAVA